ncbi:MAG: 3-hydroxybutyryl-CoA dehydrogenase [Myxococcota bacterium]
MGSEINVVGVIGAGQMGQGIAQVAAHNGCQVLLSDIDLAAAKKGREVLLSGLEKRVAKGKFDATAYTQVRENIRAIGGLEEFAQAQIVIEAASESEALKGKLFSALDKLVGPDTILASNTSSISITRLAAVTQRPDKVIGMHFMNPVPVMKLVEIIRGVATNDATHQATVALAERFGKQVVTSADYSGFIVNRILMPMINEAAFALMEGVASAEDIDTAMKLGTNQPMGPLVLADFIGLDTCLAIMNVLHEGLGDSKYRPCPLLRRLVDAGRLGRKSGHGFHRYEV